MKPVVESKDKKKCFIIMPISTPENWLVKYAGDAHHFQHVLNHLIIPSLNKVSIEPISPITQGSELIHGDIIKNIETADLVLCDMSILNPNVFFELGIRTALSKLFRHPDVPTLNKGLLRALSQPQQSCGV